MLLSFAVNFPCGEPSCWKHKIIRRYIHLGTAGGPTTVKTLNSDLAKPKLEKDYKTQEEFRGVLGKEIKKEMDLTLGPTGCLALTWNCKRSCISGILIFITEEHPRWAQYFQVLSVGPMHLCLEN